MCGFEPRDDFIVAFAAATSSGSCEVVMLLLFVRKIIGKLGLAFWNQNPLNSTYESLEIGPNYSSNLVETCIQTSTGVLPSCCYMQGMLYSQPVLDTSVLGVFWFFMQICKPNPNLQPTLAAIRLMLGPRSSIASDLSN